VWPAADVGAVGRPHDETCLRKLAKQGPLLQGFGRKYSVANYSQNFSANSEENFATVEKKFGPPVIFPF
jgi:hypothetical protein